MKKIVACIALTLAGGLLATSVHAEPSPEPSRTLVQVGVLVTKGLDSGWDHLGGGASLRTFTYLDPRSPDGWYLGFLGAALFRSVDGTSLADTRLVTLGWRGDPWRTSGTSPGFQFDVSLSPTLGARIRDTSILGSTYTGVGLTLGVGIPLWDGNDLGLSWEPVIPVTTWGAGEAPNRGYSDFVVSWTMKFHNESRRLAWSDQTEVKTTR